MTSEEVGLLVASARASVADLAGVRDYRGRFVLVGSGLVHATCALALSLDRFAAAITPQEDR